MGMNAAAVQRLYVAYFNRPADPTGLAQYEAMLSSTEAATQAELEAVAAKYFSPSAEYTSNFDGLSNEATVNKLYQNLFGRDAEPEGLLKWALALADKSETVASIALQLSFSAQGTDADTVANKIEAASAFTAALETTDEIVGYSGDAAAASAASWLATVSSSDASKDAAIAGVDAAVTAAVAAGGGGETFKLTAGVDAIVGTTGDDTITGTHLTFNSLDTIDGGDGDDSLVFTDAGTAAWTASTGATVKNVETVKITNTNGAASGAVTAVTEKADITFGSVSNGKTVIIAGLTMTAGADLTGAEVAAAFSAGATVGNAAITGTLSGYTVAAGANSNSTTFTSTTAGANVADLVTTGTVNTASAKVVSIVLTDVAMAIGDRITITIDGVSILSDPLAAATITDAGDKVAAALNAYLGATAAVNAAGTLTITSNTSVVLTPATAGDFTTATSLVSSAYVAETPTVVITQGVAESAGTYAGYTLTASKFTGATSFVNELSDSKVTISSIPTTAELSIVGNGVSTNGDTVASFSATAAPVVNISGGITGSPDLTLTGTSTTAATIKSSGAPLTSTGKIGTNGFGAVSLFADAVATTGSLTLEADSNLSMTSLTTDASSIVATGAGSVSIAATGVAQAITDANLTSVDASALEGGVTFAMSTSLLSVKGGKGADSITTAAVSALAAIDAGDGIDTLTIGAATDVDTALEGAQYKNFEVLVAAAGSYDASLVSGIQAIVLQGAGALTNLNATQAANVTIASGGQYSMALAASSGTTDSVSLTLGAAPLSTSAATSLTGGGLTANGFETINLAANPGSLATAANQKSTVAAFTADKATAINLTGSSFVLTNIATTLAVTIYGTALTGDKATTDPVGFTAAGQAVTGSTIKGSEFNDTFTIAVEGSTYDGNGGDDTFTILSADPEGTLNPDGASDLKVNGGADTTSLTAGQDILEIKSTTITDDTALDDSHFTFVTGMEQLLLSNTGDHVLTTGGSFNTAFADGVTIKTGTLAATKDITVNAGLSSVDMKITVDATSLTGAATDDIVITTGTGTDTVTITGDATWVGGAGDGGQYTINTKAGDDKISVTIGTLTTQTTTQAISITGGSGADTITKVGTNGTTVAAVAHYETPYTDSTITARDKITGYDTSTNAGALFGDVIDFSGSAAVSAFSNSVDFGVIASHSITAGLATFDDASNFAAALVINESNLSDVLGYLAANTAVNDVVVFHYDSNNDGANDGAMVFHNFTATADSLVELVGVMPAGASATATTVTDNYLIVA